MSDIFNWQASPWNAEKVNTKSSTKNPLSGLIIHEVTQRKNIFGLKIIIYIREQKTKF